MVGGTKMYDYVIIIEAKSPSHVHFKLFVDGGLAGRLTLRVDEFEDFKNRLDAEVKE